MVDGRSSDEATAEFAGVAESVRDARRFVMEVLAEEHDDLVGDAALLTSELATNAVIHAQTTFRITVRHTPDGVRVGVGDGSTSTARRCRYSATSGTGRGLGMVEDIAASWGVDVEGDGKCVWFTVRRGGRADAGHDADGEDGRRTADAEPDLDALLADLGGWDDEDPARDAALRRAA
jgi:anti-sigma regulatory factor (Ser/Thr protein kinase)